MTKKFERELRDGRRRVLVLALALATASMACGPLRTRPQPAISSLVVRNRSFFDVNIYVLPSPAGSPLRVGTVVGSSSSTFGLAANQLQTGGYLVVQVNAIGTRSSWTSNAVGVGNGILAVLDVESDAFGDCSRSNLHTIVTTEAPPP